MSDEQKAQYTSLEEIDQMHAALRAGFRSGKMKSIAARRTQLTQLGYLVQDNMERFKEAFAADLGRHPMEASFLDLLPTLSDTKIAIDRVEKWARTERAPFSLNFAATRPVIRKEPKGVVLIIAPFNYPVWLTFGPLIGALAAGNCAVLKPSELSWNVTKLMAELVPKYLDQDVVRVVLGAVPETTKLLELPWDHILYTGSGRVGKIVNMAGAKTFSPVSLELGGKSPAVIDPKCDMRTAAKRILWGKVANAGQTCVAPDYVLIERGAEDKFVEALKEAHKSFFPDKSYKEMSRIVAPSHFNRLKGLVENTQGTVVLGGLDEMDEAGKLITPTIVRGVKEDDSLMSEEIFGPVLPILPVDNVDDALEYINKHDHPLALYVFTQDAAFKAKVFDNTTSGSAVANEVLLQCATDGLPFGGIGPSGNGYQTRKYAFDMFTHLRASLDSPSWLDKIMGARYPPYTVRFFSCTPPYYSYLSFRMTCSLRS
ncbi:NAD-dependent aldehyde dehydrogenase [Coniophora puteana RWD-64-598 SS2]|uniref:Aldehyde dehydrogenase n=1 Tax=Coniophora puteana (strain RWD-64-598) TaxID=741705 RepID=A0A5M3MGC8_CONPW|nr:NAD-dependent aldehyde dehydrogenase [Coniophora puteana RWD-64-598 SS2]EIW78299.1 NAD-dependent aldehyde dehydrogenase [Coniophora puteana RWD-64-598 SS2]